MSEIESVEIQYECPWCKGKFWLDSKNVPIRCPQDLYCPYCGQQYSTEITWKEETKRTPSVLYTEKKSEE